ncbi:reverse transcriptase [Senna tora]|uniref:Reverse transcriptase n=1 Tax=Senna tora TaxID=362788 RepID=A0A834WQY9_9FABA|nr:reverse transcriptase [Senna tora]
MDPFDCLIAVKQINDTLQMSHPCSAILSRIHHWFSYDWEVKVLDIHREGNYAADAMAGKAFSCSTELVIFQDAPVFLFQMLLSDLEGKGSYRQCAILNQVAISWPFGIAKHMVDVSTRYKIHDKEGNAAGNGFLLDSEFNVKGRSILPSSYGVGQLVLEAYGGRLPLQSRNFEEAQGSKSDIFARKTLKLLIQ